MRKGRAPTHLTKQPDGRSRVFSFVGLPPLTFAAVEAQSLHPAEIVKPLLRATCGKRAGDPLLDVEGVARTFAQTFEDKTGDALDNAAAELLLTSGSGGGASDWEHFIAWASRRSQPLQPRLVEAFGRFYAGRLNETLREGESASRSSHRARQAS